MSPNGSRLRCLEKFKPICATLVCVLFALTMRGEETSTAPDPVTFMQAPQGAKLIKIHLSMQDHAPSRHDYLSQRSPQPLEEVSPVPPTIAQAYSGKEFSVFQIGSFPNGTRYLVAVNEDKSMKFLNR